MGKIAVEGGRQLHGNLRIHGAKNAALPILAATVLAEGQYSIQDVPHLSDISVMLDILTALGAKTKHKESNVLIDTGSLIVPHIPRDLMGLMRSSIFLMGPLLARFGEVIVYPPGGCAIGERKIDLHLKGLQALGASIEEYNDYIHCTASRLIGADLFLDYPSVGATENIMMAATRAKGKTIIRNAAREPEITDLQNFLNKMGAKIRGAGTPIIVIEGTDQLEAVKYKVIPDRIVAGTMLLAGCMTEGDVTIENIYDEHMESLVSVLRQCGVEIEMAHDIIKVSSGSHLKPVQLIETGPYPGFPTDMQAQLMVFLTAVNGTSIIRENVFENRFKHAAELRKMGARIEIKQNEARIIGGTRLVGSEVKATDLRAGAALILAGLACEGTTYINQIHHIDRGYDRIDEQLRSIGAQICRIPG
ncbi:UDP-N-acetylglucosamine 1-carboxyvinyltransferase [Ammoniphilus resinae]|uniref:UDP-N-acetylglucosamine 1-carboxyvinyltransferase n=1 Tax=Ammoniphilus resinae TaxID=861532 RepID=A0ABS4GK83_9BACL|nr:UDP-N-acetylglucosamine 1-carboxyvinyltransferase [Ammoniphilus resinae]MBP1930661.1 UDP-N-acetylglucosamine 1-carboxyvinyltransferase [Ammoniphilus resinae]